MGINKLFSNFARRVAHILGQPVVFTLACAVVITWLVTGPFFEFSDTWQLVINTGTTIVTFLMVFLIQNTQNWDGEAIQIKLDESIRSHKGAHNSLLDLEELTGRQLEVIKQKYVELARIRCQELRRGKVDTKTTNV